MGSRGRIPPQHLRRPLSGPTISHPDPYSPGIRPPSGSFPPYEMLPPPEVMEQKLAAQHSEMQKLAAENQRLASTHGTLRQELAAAQHELQILHAQIGAVKSDKEQQVKSMEDKIAKMEAEIKGADPVKLELQKARQDAQNLVVAREELISKAQHLNQDLQRAHMDVQQIPALMSELEALRQEYQHCRVTYDYEKKSYNDHLESLQVMEKNYMTMAREVEKLRAELTNATNFYRRPVGPYGTTLGNNENEASGQHLAGQNAYEDGYGVPKACGPYPPPASAVGSNPAVPTTPSGPVNATYAGSQPGPAPVRPGYDTMRGQGYDTSGGPTTHDLQRGTGYDPQWVPPIYDQPRGGGGGGGYESQRAGYDGQRDMQVGPGYDPQSRGVGAQHGDAMMGGSAAVAPYGGSATPPGRGGNPGRR